MCTVTSASSSRTLDLQTGKQKKNTTNKPPEPNDEVEKNIPKAKKLVGALSVLSCRAEALATGFAGPGIKERIPSYMIDEVFAHKHELERYMKYWRSVLEGNPPKVDAVCGADVVEAMSKEADGCFNRAELMLKHAQDSLVGKTKHHTHDKDLKGAKGSKHKTKEGKQNGKSDKHKSKNKDARKGAANKDKDKKKRKRI